MTSYYLDIETTGTDEVRDKIITIQYQELERGIGKPIGSIHILKEWESGESEMLQKFIIDSSIVNSYNFDFIPVGVNLGFEHKFFLEKSAKYNKFPISILSRPCVDLKSILVLMNKGEFLNSGLDKMTGKEHSGSPIPSWYQDKQYDKIEGYVIQEAKEFGRLYQWLHENMPELHTKFVNFLNEDLNQNNQTL